MRVFRIIDRLILTELIGPLINSIFLFMMLLFAAGYLFKMTDLLVQGVPLIAVGKAALYALPMLLTQTLPMSMLLAALLAFGRLSGDSESIALYAGGISFYRMVLPVAMLGLTVSAVAIVWNETVVPPATRAYYELLQHATENIQTTTREISYTVKDGDRVDEFVVIRNGYDAKTRTLRDVTIIKMGTDPRWPAPDLVVYAGRVRARGETGSDWEYYDVYAKPIRPDPAGRDMTLQAPYVKTLPRRATVGRDFRGVRQAEVTDNRRMTFSQLYDKINRDRAEGSPEAAADEVDLWEKISLPLASLIFGLVGAPLGVRPQRGSKAMGFGLAIVIIFIYWVIYHWMYVVGKNGGLPPMLASFAADILGIAAAVVLIARTRQ